MCQNYSKSEVGHFFETRCIAAILYVWGIITVWRIREKMLRTVLWSIAYYSGAQWYTHEHFLHLTAGLSLGLSFYALFDVYPGNFICVKISFWCAFVFFTVVKFNSQSQCSGLSWMTHFQNNLLYTSRGMLNSAHWCTLPMFVSGCSHVWVVQNGVW